MMTAQQIKDLKPNTKLYAWFSYDEGAVLVELAGPVDNAHIMVQRVVPVDNMNQPEQVPLNHLFEKKSECEKHCLETEEEFESYMESFQELPTFFAHLLLNSAVGHVASEGELDALAHRTSMVLGFNAYQLLSDYSKAIFNEQQKDEPKGENNNG